MTIFSSALFVINEVYADEYVRQHMTPLKVTQALADAGLLAPDPQIIRTADELAALDPDTVLMTTDLFDPLTPVWDWLDGEGNPARGTENGLPAVVIATGDQARVARQALEAPSSVRRVLPVHRTEAGYPNCSTCDGGGCLDCTDPA